jgi:hypothetical protein
LNTLRYTNMVLTVIAVCLGVLVLQDTSLIALATAQNPPHPTPVVIVGTKGGSVPVNLVGLSGHPSLPVSIVSQSQNVAVAVSGSVAVSNPEDGTPLSVKVIKAAGS